MENMNPTQFRMLTEELPEDHPIGQILVRSYLRWLDSFQDRVEVSDCGRYLVRKDRRKAWGSPEHVSRDVPW